MQKTKAQVVMEINARLICSKEANKNWGGVCLCAIDKC